MGNFRYKSIAQNPVIFRADSIMSCLQFPGFLLAVQLFPEAA